MKTYNIVLTFIIVEAVIISLFVVTTYLFKLYFNYKEKHEARMMRKVTEALNNVVLTKQPKKFPYIKNVASVIRTIEIFDEKHKDDDSWKKNKKIIVKEQLLPRARRFINSRSWYKQFLLLKCYRQYVAPEDENNIVKLINSKLPVLTTNAIVVGNQLGTKKIYRSVIYRIYNDSHQKQMLNAVHLHDTPQLHEAIVEVLSQEQKAWVRRTCYTIIDNVAAKPEYLKYALEDIESEALNLKLEAIKAISSIDSNKAVEILPKFFEEENWVVRNVALNSLGKIQDSRVPALVAPLVNDSAWWVRTNAERVLHDHSHQGRSVLVEVGKTEHNSKHEAGYYLSLPDSQRMS